MRLRVRIVVFYVTLSRELTSSSLVAYLQNQSPDVLWVVLGGFGWLVCLEILVQKIMSKIFLL